MLKYATTMASVALVWLHRIIDDRMENSIKGRRIGYNLR